MAFGDPLGYFSAGQAAGKASASPFEIGAGNVMDVFKQGIENQMKLAQTAALFKGEKGWENQNDPTKLEAQAKLNASGFGPGGGGGGMGNNVLQDAAAGGQQQQDTGTLGTNVPTEFTSVTGQKKENQRAAVDKKAAEELVAQKEKIQSNANAVDMLAELQKHYESGVKHAIIQSDPSSETNPLIAMATSQAQGRSLDFTAKKNPEWQLYQDFKKNTSFSADRNLYDEKGKLIGQQLDAGVKTLSDGYDSKTVAHGKFSTLFDMAGRSIDVYNNNVRKVFGPNSQYEVHPKNEGFVNKTHDRYLALKSIQDGTGDAEKVKMAFKNKYEEDL